MRWRSNFPVLLLTAASVVALWPALAQRSPESILPPGFGNPEPANTASPKQNEQPGRTDPSGPPIASTPPSAGGLSSEIIAGLEEDISNNQDVAVSAPVDLPPQARRSLERVGLLAPEDGGFAVDGFGATDGRFLSTLMRRMNAPVASRWASILLRRALLSPSRVPPGVEGADWVAERAWLLIRMGEADAARSLVARVDSENFTPRLYAVAMQAALAAADPSSLCSVANAAADTSNEPSWPLSQAMCAGLSGESGTASALVDKVRDSDAARGIDVLLAEKVVGAAVNSRRSVGIQWKGVNQLTAWRFGLASATGVIIPSKLFDTVGPQVQAWQARAPLVAVAVRAPYAERAAVLGVLSSSALVDFYSMVWDGADPSERSGSVGELLRTAYTGSGDYARVAAMRSLWNAEGFGDPYARRILTARAAADIGPTKDYPVEDLDGLIASMLSAGLDLQAARWNNAVSTSSVGWALLAVGNARAIEGIDASSVRSMSAGEDNRRAKFLLAALAGLGRLSADDATNLAERFDVPLSRGDSWTRALDRAAASGEAGTVALLVATGMQTGDWKYVPPAHLYHIVVAMRRVGLEPEARMMAAEAIARS